MKILSLNNKHVKKDTETLGYGCVCPNCGTVFVLLIKILEDHEHLIQIQKIVCLYVLTQPVIKC